MPSTSPSTALSRSASSKTTNGDLPPSSSDNFFVVPAVALRIARPTSVEPVNAILSTSGCATRASPERPSPVTMLTTPFGRPASWHNSAKASAVSGVNSAGLSTTVLPAATAGTIAGKFVFEQLRPPGVIIKMPRDQRYVYIAAFADRLTIIERLQHRKT